MFAFFIVEPKLVRVHLRRSHCILSIAEQRAEPVRIHQRQSIVLSLLHCFYTQLISAAGERLLITMERLGLLVIVVLSLTCISTVESSNMDIGHMITWTVRSVGWIVGARKFQNYGCYCNEKFPIGGMEPLDKIDECCMRHNQCYENLVRDNHCPRNKLHQSYGYEKVTENGVKLIKCTSHSDDCKYRLCKCDAEVAHCFGINEYHKEHKDVSKSSCVTTGK
ncbi:basic phospholipase A2-like isoform X1 [Lytechinus variegatus]|uniref:basic phospholipase A2-like isoform X1 n=2 Tax=Lytechinus variegatus TaxID=7654 RepID=UPI001BB2ACC4|nr:basic phospholipase A2-like isoform X1 [Lytechinus variegatus]